MGNVRNVAGVQAALKRFAARKAKQMEIGCKRAGLYIQAQSQKIVPWDYGELSGSAFTRAEGQGTPQFNVTVGYTASYAIYVHEIPSWAATHGALFNALHAAELARHPTKGPYRHSRGPNQVYKFLESPFRKQKEVVKQIIIDEVKKP